MVLVAVLCAVLTPSCHLPLITTTAETSRNLILVASRRFSSILAPSFPQPPGKYRKMYVVSATLTAPVMASTAGPSSTSSSSSHTVARRKVQTAMTGDNIFLLMLSLVLIVGCILLAVVIVSKRCQNWIMRQCGRLPEEESTRSSSSSQASSGGSGDNVGIPLATFTRPILRGVSLPVRNDTNRDIAASPRPTSLPQAPLPRWHGAAAPSSQLLTSNNDSNNTLDAVNSYGLDSDRARLIRPLPMLPAASSAAASSAAATDANNNINIVDPATPSPPLSPVLRTATASPVQAVRATVVDILPSAVQFSHLSGKSAPLTFPRFAAVSHRSPLQTDARHSQQSMTASLDGFEDCELRDGLAGKQVGAVKCLSCHGKFD